MRKLETDFEREKRGKRNRLILGIMLVILMLGSTAGYAFSLIGGDDTGNQVKSPGEPYYDGSSWIVEKNGNVFSFQYGPDEVKDVVIDVNLVLSDYAGKPVYIVGENNEIAGEISRFMQYYASRIQKACYGPCDVPDLPEKTCSDNLIIWNDSDANSVRQEEKCIFIEGDVRAADAFLYRLLGIYSDGN